MLDWTRNPLVALFFAVRTECETRFPDGRPMFEPAEVIAWHCGKINLAKKRPKGGPLGFEGEDPIRYVPRIVTSRLRAQSGVFTVHRYPKQIFEPKGLFRITIPWGCRKDLKASLFRLGIHEGVLFPDLDGLARHIQWCQTKSY